MQIGNVISWLLLKESKFFKPDSTDFVQQVSAFQEDFAIEQKEKREQKERYENMLAKHQDWIRQLASEVPFTSNKNFTFPYAANN